MNVEVHEGLCIKFLKDHPIEIYSDWSREKLFFRVNEVSYQIKGMKQQDLIDQVKDADECILTLEDGGCSCVCRRSNNTKEKPVELTEKQPEEKPQDKEGHKLYEFGTNDFFDRLDYEIAEYRSYWTDTTKDVDRFYNERKDCNILCSEDADDDPYKKYRPAIRFIQSLHTYDNEKLRINSKNAFDLIKKYIPSFDEVWPSKDMLGEYDILQIGGEEYDLFIMNETDENQPCILIKNRQRNVTYYINSISEETY